LVYSCWRVLCLFLDTSHMLNVGAHWMCIHGLLRVDFLLNAFGLFCDLCLAVQSGRGTMMEVDKRQTVCLQVSVCLRVVLGIAVQVNFAIMFCKSMLMTFHTREYVWDTDWEAHIENATQIEIPGWGLGFSDWKWPPVIAIFTYLTVCTILFFWQAIVGAGLMIPKTQSGELVTGSVRRALAFVAHGQRSSIRSRR